MGDCPKAFKPPLPCGGYGNLYPFILLFVSSLHPGISSKDHPLDQNKHHKNICVMGGKRKRSKIINISTALKTSCMGASALSGP